MMLEKKRTKILRFTGVYIVFIAVNAPAAARERARHMPKRHICRVTNNLDRGALFASTSEQQYPP